MEAIVRYKCVCGKVFKSKEECMLCEVSHYPMSLADYYHWQSLKNWYEVLKSDTDNVDKIALKYAASALTKFELYNNIPPTIKE